MDFHRPPRRIGKVEVKPVLQFSDADMDDALRSIEMGTRLNYTHC